MGKTFSDLDQYFDPGLTLTVRGVEYTIPLPSAELGLWCRRLASITGDITGATTEGEIDAVATRIDDLPELPGGKDVTLPERVLGEAFDQMAANEVPDPYIQFCAVTTYVWILAGEEKAEAYWRSGGRPEAPGPVPNRSDRRRARGGQSSTAAASATKSRASTSGTKSPKKSSASTAARAASRGPKS